MHPSASTALEKLKKDGFRLTAARTGVVEALAAAGVPLAAPDVLKALARRRVPADRATVYRELEALTAAGVLSAVRFEARALRYELAGAHHHHAVCVTCDGVQEIEADAELEAAERKIARRAGFTVLRHSFELFGLCAGCR